MYSIAVRQMIGFMLIVNKLLYTHDLLTYIYIRFICILPVTERLSGLN